MAIPDILEKLKLVRKKICGPNDNQVNWNLITSVLEEYFNNVLNVVHLVAWAATDAEMCEGALDPVPITGFDPWYDPADFPDIATPTEVNNTLNFEVPTGTLVKIEYNRADQVWELTQPLHERNAIGETLTYVGHAMVLGRYSASLPKPCTAVENAVLFGPVQVQKNNVFGGLVLPGLECNLYQTPTVIYLPEADVPQDATIAVEFQVETAMNDMTHVPGEGIYVNDVGIFTPCVVDIGPRLAIETGPCPTSGSGSG